MLCIIITRILKVFDIGPALDADTNHQMPKAEFDGIVSRYALRCAWTHDGSVDYHSQGPQTFQLYNQAPF